MQKRYIKKLDMELSPLGFGVMRLPMMGELFTDESYKMIAHAMELGINYYDTAYRYQMDRSEEFLRDTLVLRYPRESYCIADKLPVWECKNRDDMERIFHTQLERLGVKYIDLYLLHALNKPRWIDTYNQSVLDFLESKKKEGRIHKIGFSLHDNIEALMVIEKAFDWDFVQLQINYYDWIVQHADKSYEFLAEKEIPCIVMEPGGGGRLANLPKKAEKLLKAANPSASAFSWAIRFVASLSNVALTLSGMNTLEQLHDNISSFSPINPITGDEQKILDDVIQVIRSFNTVPCTSCGYCIYDCPKMIDIPQIFQRYNDQEIFDNMERFDINYFSFIPENQRGDVCVKCGKCVEKCPQKIDVPEWLAKIHNMAVTLSLGINADELKVLLNDEPRSLLVCFGSGQRGKAAQLFLSQCGIDIHYFCDNQEQLWGSLVNGVTIVSPVELLEIANSIKVNLFITSNYYNEIKVQLESLGFPDDKLRLVN